MIWGLQNEGLALDLQSPWDNALMLQQPPALWENTQSPLSEKQATKEHWLQSNYLGGAPLPGQQEGGAGRAHSKTSSENVSLTQNAGLKTLIPLQRVNEQFPKDSQDLLSHEKHPYYVSRLKGSPAYTIPGDSRESIKKLNDSQELNKEIPLKLI